MHSGCGRLAHDGSARCPAHPHSERSRQYSRARRARGDPNEMFYGSSRWQRLRLAVLHEEPLCRMCAQGNRVELGTVVDHIVPVKQGGEIWDRTNLQPLCRPCHEIKSRAEGARYQI